MNANVPVIYIHQGNSKYLPYTFIHNKKYNPDTRFILLGDEDNAHYSGLVEHYNISDYNKSAIDFAANYKHYSSHGIEFELFCIQRWFILEEFLSKQDIPSAIFLDSDVLSYSDLNILRKKLLNYHMTIVGISPHTNFINNVVALRNFNSYVSGCYQEDNTGFLQGKYDEMVNIAGAGGVSDMTFFHEYRKVYEDVIGDIRYPCDAGYFDISLDHIGDFIKDGYVKKVIWINNIPYFQFNMGNNIKADTIHFQGRSKSYLYQFACVKSKFILIRFLIRYYYQKVLIRIRKSN